MNRIPYIETPHPTTRLTNGKLGTWLFLASETMFFGALFASLAALRLGNPSWPKGSEISSLPLAALDTLILLASSAFFSLAIGRLKRGRFSGFVVGLAVTQGLGILFLCIKGWDYASKISAGHLPSTSVVYATYFTLTGAHALHLLGGLALNAYLLIRGKKLWAVKPALYSGRAECAALYWHFVDAIWILLFVAWYLP